MFSDLHCRGAGERPITFHLTSHSLTPPSVAQHATQDGSLEEVRVALSNDGQSFGVKPGEPLLIQCIRQRVTQPFVNYFYPEQCAALIDDGSDY